MWCKTCNIETNEKVCPICGGETVEDLPVEIYWCKHCNTPIIQTVNQADRGICPVCKRKTKYMSADLRPVFPEERLLLELLLEREPNEFINSSVWAVNSRYYIDGKPTSLSSKLFQNADTERLTAELERHKSENSYDLVLLCTLQFQQIMTIMGTPYTAAIFRYKKRYLSVLRDNAFRIYKYLMIGDC